MIDTIILGLIFSLFIITVVYGIWVGFELIQVATERDEWREIAVKTNSLLQEMEMQTSWAVRLNLNREIRPFRSNNKLHPNKNDSGITSNKG